MTPLPDKNSVLPASHHHLTLLPSIHTPVDTTMGPSHLPMIVLHEQSMNSIILFIKLQASMLHIHTIMFIIQHLTLCIFQVTPLPFLFHHQHLLRCQWLLHNFTSTIIHSYIEYQVTYTLAGNIIQAILITLCLSFCQAELEYDTDICDVVLQFCQ